jgi:hypothetical protein
MGIVKTSRRPESVTVLRRCLLGCWPVYLVGAYYGCVQGSLNTLYLVSSPKLGFEFCLDSICHRTVVVHWFVRPQFVSLIIHLQFCCVLLCSCLCSLIRGQGLAFMVRSTRQHMIDKQEMTWCFDCGLGSCWSEAGLLVSCCRPIYSYPPNGRLGALVFPSSRNHRLRYTIRIALPPFLFSPSSHSPQSALVSVSFATVFNFSLYHNHRL